MVAVVGGDNHAMALYEDGTIGHWGRCWREECGLPEATLTRITAVAAGGGDYQGFSAALKSDGTLVSVGATSPGGGSIYASAIYGSTPAVLTNVKAIAG